MKILFVVASDQREGRSIYILVFLLLTSQSLVQRTRLTTLIKGVYDRLYFPLSIVKVE